MRHEFVDRQGRFWALLDIPEWGPRELYIARDEPGGTPHAQYVVDDPEEENRSRVLAEEVLRLAEENARLQTESVIAVSIKAGEGAERQGIVEHLRELQVVPALTMRPEELAAQIEQGKHRKRRQPNL